MSELSIYIKNNEKYNKPLEMIEAWDLLKKPLKRTLLDVIISNAKLNEDLNKIEFLDLIRKKSSATYCKCNFDSQYAYIVEKNEPVEKIISITEYIANKQLQKNIRSGTSFLVCSERNELIKCSSTIKKSYFRHKNIGDSPMTEWHKRWQQCFDLIEVPIGEHRADAVVENKDIEFQYSYISKADVDDRNNNCLLHNYEIIWVIECSNILEIKSNGDIYEITFLTDHWKHTHFSNKHIYLDTGYRIFQINPAEIKSNIVFTTVYKTKYEFIQFIHTQSEWTTTNNQYEHGIIYHNQRGAGSGKTYESIQLLQKYTNKEVFIYLTKMHSAKEIIYNQLKSQITNKKIELTLIEDIQISKQYKLILKRNNAMINVYIGTIDSFARAIGESDQANSDFFRSIIESIRLGYVNSTNNGDVKYAQDSIRLNHKCLVVIDEAQDLGPNYIEAFDIIVNKTGIDVHIIGDKLQSIWHEYNIYTYVSNLKTKIIKSEEKNIVRRFHNIQFKDFVNNAINFEKYNLQPIQEICDGTCAYDHGNATGTPFEIFQVPDIYLGEPEIDAVNALMCKIVGYMQIEIDNNGYAPKNFMFIFATISRNYLANQLEAKLQDFWVRHFKKSKEYSQYVYLHKSVEGQPINLKESENMTKMMSIHASKGSDCEVVFLLGISEYSLTLFSGGKDSIVYESLLHVGITRQKRSLYIGVVNNNDDIWNRFKGYCVVDNGIEPSIRDVSKRIMVRGVVDYLKNDKVYSYIYNNLIKPGCFESKIPNNLGTSVVDWGHHLIRYSMFFYTIMKNIMENETLDRENCTASQFLTILNIITRLPIKNYQFKQYYEILNNITQLDNKERLIPILLFKSDIYKKYTNMLTDFIKDIQNKIRNNLRRKKLPDLCSFETVVLLYIMGTIQHGKFSEIKIIDVYTMMNCYDECADCIMKNHCNTCLCKKKFVGPKKGNMNDIRASIVDHYKKIDQVKTIYDNYKRYISKNYAEVFTYNIDHYVSLKKNESNFNLSDRYGIIAHSEKYVIHFVFKPTFSTINFPDVILNAIYSNYVLSQCDDIKDRFKGKKIVTCIFTLDADVPIFYEIDISSIKDFLGVCTKDFIRMKHKNYHELMYDYYKFYEKNKPQGINSIQYMYNNFKLIADKMPEYLSEYYNYILSNITIAQNKGESAQVYIEKIKNREMFLAELNICLDAKIDKFLGMNAIIDNNF